MNAEKFGTCLVLAYGGLLIPDGQGRRGGIMGFVPQRDMPSDPSSMGSYYGNYLHIGYAESRAAYEQIISVGVDWEACRVQDTYVRFFDGTGNDEERKLVTYAQVVLKNGDVQWWAVEGTFGDALHLLQDLGTLPQFDHDEVSFLKVLWDRLEKARIQKSIEGWHDWKSTCRFPTRNNYR